MQAVIICGGKGTRLKSIIGNRAKALIKFNKIENLKNQIEILKKNGVKNFLFLVNNFENQIKSFLKKNYTKKFITFKDQNHFGTGGCLYGARKKLKKKFLIIYSDLYFNFNFKNFIKSSSKKKCLFSCVVHANDHPQDSDTVIIDKNFFIKKILKKNTNSLKMNSAIAGIFFAKKNFLRYFNFKKTKSYDLVNDVLPQIIKKHCKIFAYKTIEYIKDFGTINRIKNIRKDIKNNQIKNLFFYFKTKSVFLDRDGVINKESKKIKNIKNFHIFPKVKHAIKKLNKNKIPCFIVSNQSGLAKNEFGIKELQKIISILDLHLSKNKAYIDDFLICPHFDDIKYKGKKMSFFSNYRKPDPGMIIALANKYRISLKKSFIIGDSDKDILAGKKAGLKTILVKSSKIHDYKINVEPSFRTKDINSAVNIILKI